MTITSSSVSASDCDILRVGVCQIYTEQWQIEQNFKRTMEALEEAADKGAILAITPECVLHGYGFSDDKELLRKRTLAVSETLSGERVSEIRALAKKLSLNVVLGIAERGTDDKIHNSALFITQQGEIAEVYRKVHCRRFESVEGSGAFTPGDRFAAVELSLGQRSYPIGLMICFDREIPESTRCLRAMGAQFVACPLATNTSDMNQKIEKADNEMITRCRAAENEMFIAVVNHSGRFNGGSFFVGPKGELLIQLGKDPAVEVINVPIGIVEDEFHSNPLGWMGWGYRRQELYDKHFTE